jgi:glutamate/tyrosine decarboxylase-like PLP-dependent enzyme
LKISAFDFICRPYGMNFNRAIEVRRYCFQIICRKAMAQLKGDIVSRNEAQNHDHAEDQSLAIERAVFIEASRRAVEYLTYIRGRSVFPLPEAVQSLELLGGLVPDSPRDPLQVLDLLDRAGSAATVANSGGRYFGFVCGGALPAARAANVLAAAWDQNVGLRVLSPVGAFLEEISLAWVVDILGLPRTCAGAVVVGATAAGVTALAAARDQILRNRGWDVEAMGLFGAPPIPVYVSEEVHTSVLKALALLGLGRQRVITLPADDQGRIIVSGLPQIGEPSIVCIQAGDVNTGSFDKAGEICRWAHECGSWVHVDGAFGLWAAASPEKAHLTAGFANADSWSLDGHKWLNVPYDCGIAFVRSAESLRSAMSVQASYLQLGQKREPVQWNLDMSHRARGVEIWAAIQSLGRSGIAEMIERCCRHAVTFAAELAAAGYAVLNDVVLNQVLVSFGSDTETEECVRAIQEDGTCWCSSTRWKGQVAMRISVCSWATTDADVKMSIAAIIRTVEECKKRLQM